VKEKLLGIIRGDSKFKKTTIRLLRKLKLHKFARKFVLGVLGQRFLEPRHGSVPPGEMIFIHGLPLLEKEVWFSRFEEAVNLRKIHADPRAQHVKEKVQSGKQEISVLISLFESDKFLPELVQNILSQTALSSSQIIFVSVTPSPFVQKTLHDFKTRMPSAQIIESVERVGIYQAWNIALAKADSPLLTNWNADDRRSKTSLEDQISFMTSNPWVSGSYADTYITIDALADFEIAAYCGALTDLPPFLSIHQSLSGANPMHNAPVWRRDLHRKHGLFDDSLRSAGDYEFWLRCQLEGEVFVKSPIPYATYFINPTGVSTRPGTEGIQESLAIQKKYKRQIQQRLIERKLPGADSSVYRHNLAAIKKLEDYS
jgi:hypothetical protein